MVMTPRQFIKLLIIRKKVRLEKLAKQAANKPKKKTKFKKEVRPFTQKSYKSFLRSKYWKSVRETILKRDSYRCRGCYSTTKLQVHHLTYKNHFKEHENLDDLITLCDACHREQHEISLTISSYDKNQEK